MSEKKIQKRLHADSEANRPAKTGREPSRDGIPHSTVLLISLLALGVGFLGGVVFSAYKTGSGAKMPASVPGPAPTAQAPEPISEAQTKRLAELKRETAEHPNNADAWKQLGNLYFDTHNFTGAIDAYKRSMALDPDNADVQTDLGVMYRRNGQPKEAVEAFDRAIRIDPRHEVSRFNKGVVLLHDLNDREGAIRVWEELVAMNPAAVTPGGQPLKDLLDRFRKTPEK